MKIHGSQVENAPVVRQLIQLKVLLSKMKPVEQKLEYQIDKLIKVKNNVFQKETIDHLKFKPNPEAMQINDAQEKYIPPKLRAVMSKDDLARKRKAQERHKVFLQQKISQSLGLNETEDRPTIVKETQNYVLTQKQQERIRYEEDNYTRLPLTKNDKKIQRKQLKQNINQDFENFKDLDDIKHYFQTNQDGYQAKKRRN